MSECINSHNLNQLINNNANIKLIDVRTPLEFKSQKIDGSINIPLSDLEKNLDKISKDETCYLICRSGARANTAYSILSKNGYKPVVLTGGIMDYANNQFPVLKESGKLNFTIEQQVQIMVGLMILVGFYLDSLRLLVFFCGLGLLITGLTGSCLLGKVLLKAPWNSSCNKAC